jgi:hypothetical protein
MKAIEKFLEKLKKKICIFCRVSGLGTRQKDSLPSVLDQALGKESRRELPLRPGARLPSVNFCQVLDTRQNIVCRVFFFAKCQTLGKG